MTNIIINDLEPSTELKPEVMAEISGGKIPGPAGKVLDALKLGWNIGKALDSRYGISDTIADTGSGGCWEGSGPRTGPHADAPSC
ncbi:MAG: hypothetical protein V3U75_06185 [Methylococcaceae bacterium]